MTTPFRVDLLHPGQDLRQIGWMAKNWEEWFVGREAPRRLALFALGALVVLGVILVAAVLLPLWQLSSNVTVELPRLRRDLAARDTDLNLLKSNLGALSEESRRQVRWAELLATLGREIPPGMKLSLVDASSTAPAPGQGQAGGARPEGVLRIDAVTPVRVGSPPLLDVAQFMAALMRDPVVSKRFQLKSWDIKSPSNAPAAPGAQQVLNVAIVLADRAQ